MVIKTQVDGRTLTYGLVVGIVWPSNRPSEGYSGHPFHTRFVATVDGVTVMFLGSLGCRGCWRGTKLSTSGGLDIES